MTESWMTRFFVFIALLAIAPNASSQDDAPFPEYPDFIPDAAAGGDQMLYSLGLLNLFEAAPAADDVPIRLEGFFRIGTDYNRFWLKGEGEGLAAEGTGGAEVQALYSRLISPYFEAQAGLRLDALFGDGQVRTRPLLAVALEGLAPYWFEIEPALFLSSEGHLSARFEGSYDLLITQRFVLQPEAEINLALQEVEDWGVGSGLNAIEAGLRLRYEIRSEVAPYVGISWLNRFGGAAEFAREEDESTDELHFVLGLRLWR